MNNKPMKNTRLLKAGGYATVISLFAIAIVVVINLIANAIPTTYTKLDISGFDVYTLAEENVEMVKALNEEVTLYYVVQAVNADIYVQGITERYDQLSDKITLKTIDPGLHPTFVEKYTSDGLSENSVVVESAKRYKVVRYDEMYELDYTNYYYTGQPEVSGFKGDSMIASAIDYVTTDILPTVYFLEGHGEAALDDYFLSYIEEENIATASLALIATETIPEDCDCILINSPKKDISQEERDRLISYVGDGGHLMVMTSFEVETPNLDAVMAHYGAERESGLVFDEGANSYYMYPYYLLPRMGSHAVTEPLSGMYLFAPFTGAIRQAATVRDTVTYTALLSTTSQGYLKTDLKEGDSLARAEGDKTGSFDLAVALEETVENGTAKIVWIANDQMMGYNADYTCAGANSALFINCLGWMCEKESAVSMHTKSLAQEVLTVGSTSANIWGVVLIFLVPASLIAIGTMVYVKRRRA
ncbi:MAG: hypothetical protein E7655_05360 [Ruminococcaceae bacterium]|nr:hypothetical protein [Oscillospiraceae bacterium]